MTCHSNVDSSRALGCIRFDVDRMYTPIHLHINCLSLLLNLMADTIQFRLSRSAHKALALLMKECKYKDPGQAFRMLLRTWMMRGVVYPVAHQIGEESFTTQEVIDELLLALRKAGKSLNHKMASEPFLRQAKDEALARRAGAIHDTYLLKLAENRIVGPHRLEKLQEWVGLEVISPHFEIRHWQAKSFVEMANLHGFFKFPSSVRRKITEQENLRKEERWLRPVTARQLNRLKFFELPFVREGITLGRASEYLDNWQYIDPKRNSEYEASKKKKTAPPEA